MLKPYHSSIDEVAFVYAHTGLKEDDGNRIYEIAAAILSRDASRRDFSSLIRYRYLTERERYHSNIARDSLKDAPSAEEVASRLRSFLGGQAFILVLDPYSVLDVLLRFCAKDRCVDLSFAAEYFLPHVESFSPRGLWEYLTGKRREKISFSAAELVDLSIELVRHICGVRLNDERHPSSAALRYYLEASDTLLGEVLLHLARHYQEYWGGLFSPVTQTDTANWMQFLEKARAVFPSSQDQEGRRRIPEQRIESLFQGMADGTPGFKFRETQLEYARRVTEALNDGAVLTLEAGTGTGKTQGYLIPVMEYLRLNPDVRVVISTYTKSLQDQIYAREISRTVELERDYREIGVALLKGKSNYLCAEKLNSAFEEDLKGVPLLTWLYFVHLIFLFRQADGEAVGERVGRYLNVSPYFRQLQNEISAKTGCTGHHFLCPAQVALAEARSARVVITNHHKLALIDLDEELSGLFRNCIIDEANHFEQAVRNAFRLSVNSREIMDTVAYLELALQRISRKAAGEVETAIGQCYELLSEFQQAVQVFGNVLRTIFPSYTKGELLELPISHVAYPEGDIEKVLRLFADLLKTIVRSLSFLKDPDTARALKILPRSQERIKNALSRLFSEGENFLLLEKTIRSDNRVAACQLYSRNWLLMVHAVDVSGLIQRHVYGKRDGIVYTSATLRQRNRFDDFCRIVGMDCPDGEKATPASGGNEQPVLLDREKREFRFSALPSPFSRESMKMILPKSAVNGSYENKQVWLKTVAELLPELIRRNRGRTLVLFSSYADLEAVAIQTGDEIVANGFPLLIQTTGQPTGNLIDEFRLIKESVLFGVDTFWYGVDFQGDTLTQVIITRIPFPYPFDPLQIARKKMLPAKEFWNRYYYEAMIKLKQGIGRLIRSENDRGQVVFLDSRCRHFEELWH
ncbi:ATP-dependent DNA helicase DinG [Syntrophus gentianae]|uniref:ATP-dependent DNA helicase DinG n=1 Tax=Syntrophus gentianae TaxID=43775 RepID=A0A1H7Z836_9BACT|nr:ATP-dependent DNA helicase [Syntrophus gentianae]SEM53649.1 ATP-dependent DNA helicase DinG [Syntrophus gentianae]